MSTTPSSADERAPECHELKTDPEVFQAVWDNRKTFEIRRNDRDFQVGDVLNLRETQHTGGMMAIGAPLIYTGRELDKRVSHVLTGYGLDPAWCCLSFEPDRASLGAAQAPSDSAMLNALREAEAGLEFAAAAQPQTTEFVPAHIAALKIVREALAGAAQVPSIQEIMFSIYDYAAVSDGIDAAEGEARTLQKRRMRDRAAAIREALAALSQPSQQGQRS